VLSVGAVAGTAAPAPAASAFLDPGPAVSARAVTLARGVLRDMSTRRLLVGVLVLAVGMLTAGAGVALGRRSPPVDGSLRAALATGKQPRLDLSCAPLPPGALVRLGSLRLRPDGFYSAALSPDVGVVAWVENGGGARVHLCELASGKEFRQLHCAGWAHAVTLSPDGRVV